LKLLTRARKLSIETLQQKTVIYFDNNSTTNIAPEISKSMKFFVSESCEEFSLFEQKLQETIEKARQNLAKLIGAESSDEIFFTSSGTESIRQAVSIALKANSGKKHLITTKVEHESTRNIFDQLQKKGFQVTWLEVDEHGFLDLDELKRSLHHKDTCLVSLMTANDKTGVIFPVDEASKIVKEFSNAFFHSDGAIAVGKIPINLRESGIDLFSLSGHKFHAPKGIGALYVNRRILKSLSEPPFAEYQLPIRKIVGIGEAALIAANLEPMNTIEKLREKLEKGLIELLPDAKIIGASNKRLPNTSMISFPKMNGELIKTELKTYGVFVSTASACDPHSSSHLFVMQSMDIPYDEVMGTVRFSLGRYNNQAEVDFVIKAMLEIINKMKKWAF
jgi:cysteine desulfurase